MYVPFPSRPLLQEPEDKLQVHAHGSKEQLHHDVEGTEEQTSYPVSSAVH